MQKFKTEIKSCLLPATKLRAVAAQIKLKHRKLFWKEKKVVYIHIAAEKKPVWIHIKIQTRRQALSLIDITKRHCCTNKIKALQTVLKKKKNCLQVKRLRNYPVDIKAAGNTNIYSDNHQLTKIRKHLQKIKHNILIASFENPWRWLTFSPQCLFTATTIILRNRFKATRAVRNAGCKCIEGKIKERETQGGKNAEGKIFSSFKHPRHEWGSKE